MVTGKIVLEVGHLSFKLYLKTYDASPFYIDRHLVFAFPIFDYSFVDFLTIGLFEAAQREVWSSLLVYSIEDLSL